MELAAGRPDLGPLPGSRSRHRAALDFEGIYRADPDPWEVGTSWYERRKIALVLGCLRRERYAVCWDAGCGTGHLTAALAPRCDAVLATDVAPEAVRLTAARTAEWPGVRCAVSALPAAPAPDVRPDLVLLSEVLYYLEAADRQATYDLVTDLTCPDADVVGVHWRAQAEGYRQPGARTQRELGDALAERGWTRVVTLTDEEFLVGVWSRDLPDCVGRR